ncbi:MAG: DUF4421 domain-containing protein [Lachnospiraceae bacterium]|nr:DUF4421 domain-containing protein [Lachnospiraceae bacterium]
MGLRKFLCILSLILTMLPVTSVYAEDTDSVSVSKFQYKSQYWFKQLIENGFRINDPGVNYPKFPRFLLKIYNWGDKTFNSYDKEYVVGTGKNWKLTGKNYNWLESYALFFTSHTDIRMNSDPYSDIGAHIGFMAVNVGYTFKADELFGKPKNTRSHYEYGFTCSRLAANVTYTKTSGGVKISKFGDYDLPHSFSFNGVRQKTFSLDAYYFFNNKKYSQAAAYCYSKYQLKSAGSMIAGFNYGTQNINLDFTKLPIEMMEWMPGDYTYYNFHYTEYNITLGYAYNWVLHPRRWLVNVTVLPSVGYKHSYEDSTDGKKDMFALAPRVMLGVVYNHRNLFASLNGRFDGHLHFGDGYTFFNSIESLSLNVGMRF